MATYTSFEALTKSYEEKLAKRIVCYITPTRNVSMRAVGDVRRILVAMNGLKVIVAEYRNGIRHSRSYQLAPVDKSHGICWGGPDEAGTASCRLLDKLAPRITGKDTLLGRELELLSNKEAKTVTAAELEGALPRVVAEVSPHQHIGWHQPAMERYIWKLWLDEVVRLEREHMVGSSCEMVEDESDVATEQQTSGSNQSDPPAIPAFPSGDLQAGIVIELHDLGVDHVILPETSDAEERLRNFGVLNSPSSLKLALGDEMFDKIARYIWRTLLRTTVVPVDLIDPADRPQLSHRFFWDLTDYVELSKSTVGSEKRYEWFVALEYDELSNLRLSTGFAEFNFAEIHGRSHHDKIMSDKAKERREKRLAERQAQKSKSNA